MKKSDTIITNLVSHSFVSFGQKGRGLTLFMNTTLNKLLSEVTNSQNLITNCLGISLCWWEESWLHMLQFQLVKMDVARHEVFPKLWRILWRLKLLCHKYVVIRRISSKKIDRTENCLVIFELTIIHNIFESSYTS